MILIFSLGKASKGLGSLGMLAVDQFVFSGTTRLRRGFGGQVGAAGGSWHKLAKTLRQCKYPPGGLP